ncbi:unnamed protein product [Schistosoma mattheei]|uniref:Integrase catalytic domain-containing protein n=1 Tax=Schistosoma mattheei TaxID=31246 RepID=A0AA85BC06_9TREM|nr:unnamed protein product [Schistosoma mattheei]
MPPTNTKRIQLLSEMFARNGLPDVIVSDNDSQFTSTQFQDFCQRLSVKHLRSPPYHPQPNCQAGRFVDTFKRALIKLKGEGTPVETLQNFLFVYRTTPSDVLPEQKSPEEILMGRELRTVHNLTLPKTTLSPSPTKLQKLLTYEFGCPVFARDYKPNHGPWRSHCGGSLQRIPYEMKDNVISANFTVRFLNTSEEGLYHLYFHNCAELNVESGKRHSVNLTLKMVEKNVNSYLSAGQQPLPMLYAISCLAYLFLSIFWFVYLRKSKNSVYRIHYLMLAVTVVKSISLGFHSVNYYVIGKHGAHEESWAVMYYITHIIRGALLFITILLIGAGWAFIKHMLTPRERNVFLIVVPLQVLANIATIIIEESEAGAARYATWKEIFIFVDLACCGAILFPVVWSIKLLKAASQTDGKAAINLRNLRLFRHFYILVICYVYFTRVIVYLMTITVVYSYSWLVELFKETVTFIFFISVGYEFRPVNDNPYLLVSDEDDDEDTVMERMQMEDIWSQSGLTDGVTRVQRSQSKRKSNIPMKTYPKSQDKESLLQGVENA